MVIKIRDFFHPHWVTPEAWFAKELRLANPNWVAKWNPQMGRWEIRHKIDGGLIKRVHKTDDKGRDVGYLPLDRRVLIALAIGRRNAERLKEYTEEIDIMNEVLEEKGDQDMNLLCRDMAEMWWKYNRTHTVI